MPNLAPMDRPSLEHDSTELNHALAFILCLSMIFSENRFPLFRIMLYRLSHPQPLKYSALERARDGALRIVLDLPQMILAAKTFRIDLVDFLGAGRPRREPAAVG
jgi:hypothetical protein